MFDKYGKKIADCSSIRDAIMLVQFDKTRTHRQVKYINPETVNVPHVRLEDDFQLPAQQILSQSNLQPLDLK